MDFLPMYNIANNVTASLLTTSTNRYTRYGKHFDLLNNHAGFDVDIEFDKERVGVCVTLKFGIYLF